MGHHTCCVVNCKNNGVRNKECKFYKFPAAQYKVEQRKKWIAAVKRKNPDGSPWCPKRWDLICSAHFIGNKKSEEELSPSYIPTIFPPAYETKVVDQTGATKRHERLIKRRINQQEPITTTKAPERVVEEVMEQPEPDNDSLRVPKDETLRKIWSEMVKLKTTFPRHAKLCSDHFNVCDIIMTSGKHVLRNNSKVLPHLLDSAVNTTMARTWAIGCNRDDLLHKQRKRKGGGDPTVFLSLETSSLLKEHNYTLPALYDSEQHYEIDSEFRIDGTVKMEEASELENPETQDILYPKLEEISYNVKGDIKLEDIEPDEPEYLLKSELDIKVEEEEELVIKSEDYI